MPRSPRHALSWSQDHAHYELSTHGQLTQQFRPEDEHLWLAWLETSTSFAFHGQASHLNVYQEARSRGGVYWYAYHTTANRTRKRYLGQTARVTFARLEQEAKALGMELVLASEAPEPPLPEAEQRMVLMVTKLSHPLLPSSLVARERLLSKLDAALSHSLTLLSASAGWGKTTLLSTWAARSRFPIAWLSLGELDNDPTRFWVSVLAALRTCLPGVGALALEMLRSPQPPPLTTVLTTLVNEVSGLTGPTVLLLDDYHMIQEQTIHDALLFLLEHLPVHMHLILASRIDPPLALARLRVRGHLLELRDADLRFQEDEAARFLTHTMNLALDTEEVAVLTNRTEGWIAGLQLAALSMQQHQDLPAFVREFVGGHRYLLDYVQEEILVHLPVALQDFFLHISILRRMTASLCQAVTTQANSQELLETLERANLFLVPLDAERRWYRVHDLFREALLARLHAIHPTIVLILHQRAARWYEEQGELQEAIEHLFAAQDFSSAARLMEQVLEDVWLRGEIQTLYRWIMTLPVTIVHAHGRLVLTATLYLLNASASTVNAQVIKARAQTEQMMAQLEVALWDQEEEALPAHEHALLQQRLRQLRAWSALYESQMQGDIERFFLICQQTQELILEDEILWQMIPLSCMFLLHSTLRLEGGRLIPALQDAKQKASQGGDRYAAIKVRQWLALAYKDVGQLHLAYQESLTSLALIEQAEGHTLLTGYFYSCLGALFYEWNRLEEARHTLQRLIYVGTVWQQIDLQMEGYEMLIEVELVGGNLTAAYHALQEMERLAQQWEGTFYQPRIIRKLVHWWLAAGNMTEAANWAEQVIFHQEAWEPLRSGEFLALIRVYLAQKRYCLAVETLERFRVHLDRPENKDLTVSFLALYVVALHRAGMSEQARAAATHLLALSEPGGYLRAYLDAGEAMREVLQLLLDAALLGPEEAPQKKADGAYTLPRAYISRLLTTFAEEEQRRALRTEELPIRLNAGKSQLSPLPQNMSPTSLRLAAEDAVPVLLEPLSTQEQRVLYLLVAGQTYAEMAATLIVSRNTIKTQVSSIYRKLGVNRRAEAIALAQHWSLLSPT